jgi:hypothetical protein
VLGSHVVSSRCVKLACYGGWIQWWRKAIEAHWLRHNPAAKSDALLCKTREADSTCTGCWASSGYSVQGCAQLEQKLRQCMDAPVGPPSTNTARIADHPSALRTRRRTTSTTIFPGCIPRSRVPTSGIDSILLADRTLYIISIPTATCPRPTMRI